MDPMGYKSYEKIPFSRLLTAQKWLFWGPQSKVQTLPLEGPQGDFFLGAAAAKVTNSGKRLILLVNKYLSFTKKNLQCSNPPSKKWEEKTYGWQLMAHIFCLDAANDDVFVAQT